VFALIVCSHTHTTNTHLTCTITEHNKQTKKQTNKRKKQTKKQTNKRKNKQTNEQTNTTMSSKTIFSSTWLDITSLSVKVGKRRRKKKKFDYLFLFSKVIQEKVQDGIRESATQKLCQSSKYIFFSFNNNYLQWAPFNGITDNGDQSVNGIKLISFDKSQITISY
jgi:hypothetical protein